MKTLETFFSGRNEIALAYLFGSKAKGTQRPSSDTDIAVLLDTGLVPEHLLDYKLQMLRDLTGVLHSDDVDLVILNDAPPLLKFQVAKHGKLLYRAKNFSDVSFRARAFMEYLDIKPMLDFFTKDAVRKIRGA